MAPSTFLLSLIPGVYLLADLLVFHGPVDRALDGWVEKRLPKEDEIAVVAGSPITRSQVAEALRHRLFRRGLDWNSLNAEARSDHRRITVQQLIDLALLRQARSSTPATAAARAVTAELNDFIAEFDPRSEFLRRLGLQQQTEAGLVEQMHDRQADLIWLEQQLEGIVTPPPAAAPTVPEAWRISHLFLSAHEKDKPDRSTEIQALHQQLLVDPTRFAELVAAHSEDERTKTRAGDLGWVSTQRMPEDFMSAVRSQTPKQISGPVKTRLGWHLLLVTDHRPARAATQAEWQPEARSGSELRAREQKLASIVSQLRQTAAGSYVIHAEQLATVEPSGYSTERPPTPVGAPTPTSS